MKHLLLAGLFACLFSITNGQTFEKTLTTYGEKFQQEKAYLHYDKASYMAGETIWYKAYLMEDLYPSLTSKTFYVDWVAEDGKVLWHSVSPVVDGTTNGQFEIPSDYQGDFIHVRAYTRWMLNFDTAFLYSKDISVIAAKPLRQVKTQLNSSLQFFPEGGEAVTGISNRIAFKVTDQFGRPVEARGVIVDEKGSKIDSFFTVHDGMGSLQLLPQEGKKYSARWKDAKGALKTTELPSFKPAGISLQIMNENQKVTLLLNSVGLTEQQKKLQVIGTMNQRIAFKSEVDLSSTPQAKRIIPTASLPSGILTITVFDAQWQPLAERICFVDNKEYTFPSSMEVTHWGLGKRKRNEIEIKIPDNMTAASLSVSVTDAAIETDSSEHIISHFLLSSDIRGKVHNPAYYFSASPKAFQHLDLVMLTHGWRKFKWEEVAKGVLPKITYPKDSNYLALSGQLYGVAKSQLSGTDNIVLVVKEDTATRMLIMPIATDGSFGDPEIVIFDTIRVYYSLKSKFFKTAEARFMLNRLPAPNYGAFSKNFAGRVVFTDTAGQSRHVKLTGETLRLLAQSKSRMMENVTVTAKQKTTIQEMDDKYTSALFKGDSYQFDLVNDPFTMGYQTALQFLQGKVAGLTITDNPPSLSWRGGAPAMYVDEMVSDVDMVTTIPVTDIAYIKVFRPPFMGGFNGGNGAIAIYTRRGDDMKRVQKGLTTNQIAGYTLVKEFYSPNYDRFDVRNEQPDLRTTLYWNPMVIADGKNKTIKLSFYNNDVSGAFRVVIQGMSSEGLLTYHTQLME